MTARQMRRVRCCAPRSSRRMCETCAQARNLVNLDNLCDRLRYAGPKEQLYFVDACRDLAFGSTPGNVPLIDCPIALNPSGPQRPSCSLLPSRAWQSAWCPRGPRRDDYASPRRVQRPTGQRWSRSDDHQGYVVPLWSQFGTVSGPWCEHRPGPPPVGAVLICYPNSVQQTSANSIRHVTDPPSRPLTITIERPRPPTTLVALAQASLEVREPRWPPEKKVERL